MGSSFHSVTVLPMRMSSRLKSLRSFKTSNRWSLEETFAITSYVVARQRFDSNRSCDVIRC